MQKFYLPTEVITGRGCLAELGRTAARYGRRAMLVCGVHFARRSGLLDRALGLLRGQGLEVTVYDAVKGEADLATVEAGIALAREQAVEVLVGLGGGSAMDTAKAIAGLVKLPGSVWEYHAGRPLEGPGVPLITVPTTAGSGAEVTKNAVLIDPRTDVKKSIRDDAWFARVALVDPETTLSMPPQVTASTGSDALCQAIESFTSIGATPITDGLAKQAIQLIGRSLLRAYTNGNDLAAREDMLMGSLMAGMAMVNARLGAVHGMAHPLGSHYHIPHGVICGLLLPYVMEYNLPYATAKYAEVAQLLGNTAQGLSVEVAARKAVDMVRDLVKRVGIPSRLGPFGVAEERFDLLAQESMSESLRHNPRPMSVEDVKHLLKTIL